MNGSMIEEAVDHENGRPESRGRSLVWTVFLAILVGLLAASLAKLLLISICLLYTSPSPRDLSTSRMPSSA